MSTTSLNWIRINGQADGTLAAELEGRVGSRLQGGKYSAEQLKDISSHSLPILGSDLSLSDVELEKLRTMCQLWEINLHVREITSHRKILGPIVVGVKRLIFPIIRALFKDFIVQQRAFNGAVVSFMAELSKRKN